MSEITTPLDETEYWSRLMEDIYGVREGGVIQIIDAEDARKGVGKTGAAVALGVKMADVFDYNLTEEDLVLSGDSYLQRIRSHPGKEQPSVVIWDEAVGAGSGDSRRAMAEQNRVMSQAWQLERTKRIVHIVTLPDWNDLDKRLRKLADYRIHCLRKPIGYFKAYFIGTPFDGNGVHTRGLGRDEGEEAAARIRFPDMTEPEEHPLYRALAAKKAQLLSGSSFDADEVLADGGGQEDVVSPEEAASTAAREEAVKTTLRAVQPWDDDGGMSYRDAAKLTDYSYSWVKDRIGEWQDGDWDHLEVE